MYLAAFCDQAYIMKSKFLDAPQFLLNSQRQSGVKDVHLTLCLADNIPFKPYTSQHGCRGEVNLKSCIRLHAACCQ
jgi:hypothetical protein